MAYCFNLMSFHDADRPGEITKLILNDDLKDAMTD